MSALSEIVQGYVETGFTKREAIRLITSDHLRSHNARGKGSRAKRRARAFRFTDQPLTPADLARAEAWYAARRPKRQAVQTIGGEF